MTIIDLLKDFRLQHYWQSRAEQFGKQRADQLAAARAGVSCKLIKAASFYLGR